jgi:hypothetical protein
VNIGVSFKMTLPLRTCIARLEHPSLVGFAKSQRYISLSSDSMVASINLVAIRRPLGSILLKTIHSRFCSTRCKTMYSKVIETFGPGMLVNCGKAFRIRGYHHWDTYPATTSTMTVTLLGS